MLPERAVVVGAGVAGLGTALGLARSGWDVTLLDRDDLSAADDPDAAFAIQRRGAPQVRHTHGLLARLTGVLRERYPDVLETLVSAGGVEVDLTRRFGDHQPGDEQLRVLLARRTTLEWSLRKAAANESGVRLLGGMAATGLAGQGSRVTGVRVASGERLDADLVVAAGGRRDPTPRWLAELGVEIPEEEHDTGIVYLTRWYRTSEDWDPVIGGEELVKLGGDLGYLFYLAVPADRGTFSLTMAVSSTDDVLRATLLDLGAFDRAASALPLPEGLVAKLIPDGPVHPMGALVNRIRRFLDADGHPLVTGFHAVGDAHTCTNPIYGRGCSLALAQSVALVDAQCASLDERVRAYEAACRDQIEPWYHVSVQTDRGRRARAAAGGDREPSPIEQFFAFGGEDPLVGRAILRAVNVLATPQELMADAALVGRAMQLTADQQNALREHRNRWVRAGPTRQEMLDLTAA